MTMTQSIIKNQATTDPKIPATKAELDRLEEHEAELKAEYDKADVTFTREPTEQAFAVRAVAEQKWKNGTAAANAKRSELNQLLDAQRKAERARQQQVLFQKVDPAVTVGPHTARVVELTRNYVRDLTLELNAMAIGASEYNATLPQLHALGCGGGPINLAPELAAIQKAVADLDSNEFARTLRFLWNESSPPFWKIEIAIPGDLVHSSARP
ncbi:MAG TPA: hypothetical protein VK550_22660 [Polyangiaceae bacterium]|nr:hypothetical protein [Polyangiaceae bacterium]